MFFEKCISKSQQNQWLTSRDATDAKSILSELASRPKPVSADANCPPPFRGGIIASASGWGKINSVRK